MSQPVSPFRLSRRGFSQRIAGFTAVTATTAATALTASDAAHGEPGKPAKTGQGRAVTESPAADSPPPPPELPPPEDLLLLALIQRYPSPHLSPERLAGIRAGIQRNLAQSDRLRQTPLTNADAPAIIFRAHRQG